jgi:hypothetical protein
VHTKGIYENWRKDINGKRIFLLARQAYAGQQRNAATLWSSDISCTFASFKNQVPQAINACVAGIPYWTSDIGGYHFNWQAPDWSTPANRELFTRWFQFGTFSPIMRIHGKGERALFSNNWDAATKTILLKYDNLRYRLLPYIYSLSSRVTNDNYTIMRSLAFDFRTDGNVYNIPDQYMLGRHLWPIQLLLKYTRCLMQINWQKQERSTCRRVLIGSTSGLERNYLEAKLLLQLHLLKTMPLYVKAAFYSAHGRKDGVCYTKASGQY